MMHPGREQWWILVKGRHVLSAGLTALFRFITLLLPSRIATVSCSVLCAAKSRYAVTVEWRGDNGRRNYELLQVHLKGKYRIY
jgi:hypothetical protein